MSRPNKLTPGNKKSPASRSTGSLPRDTPGNFRKTSSSTTILPSWVSSNKFGHKVPGKLTQAANVAMARNGTIAVADRWSERVNIYNHKGAYITSLDTRQHGGVSIPWGIAVSSDGMYYVTDLGPSVKVFDSKYKFAYQFPGTSYHIPDASDDCFVGITLDNNGTLLVGEAENRTINRFTTEGKLMKGIRIKMIPRFLSVTADSNIIVSAWEQDQTVQVWSSTGQLIHNLNPPLCISGWETTGVCYRNGFIFVCYYSAAENGKGHVYCFSLLGEYAGCATSDISNPFGLFVSQDGDKMLIINEEKKDGRTLECCVKEFTMKST